MGFMSEYKRLDNLCRDMGYEGISGYIGEMERSRGRFFVPDWENDYRNLKHYRWVRNRIAHETYAEEENMCRSGDVEWLENFHKRIVKQADPLALAGKQAGLPAPRRRAPRGQACGGSHDIRDHLFGCAVTVLAVLAVILLFKLLFHL